MANKKAKSAGNQAKSNQPKPKGGKQVKVTGSGSGSAQQSQPNSAKVDLSSKFAIRNNGTNGDITVTGSEIIGVAVNTSAGNMIFVADMNPTTWASTRVSRMVPLFETYRIESLRVTYVPACSTSTGGLLYMYYDRDPDDAPIPSVSSASALTQLMSNQNAMAGQVWKPLSLQYKPSPSEIKAYYAAPVNDAGGLRLTSQGMIYAYSSAAQSAVMGGLFKFDYVIKLMTPTGPTSIKSAITPWGFSSIYAPSVAAGSPLLFGGIPSLGVANVSEYIIEVMVEYILPCVIDGVSKNLQPYTPVYGRYLAGVWRYYPSYAAALAWAADWLAGPGGGVTAGNGWARILAAVSSSANAEST